MIIGGNLIFLALVLLVVMVHGAREVMRLVRCSPSPQRAPVNNLRSTRLYARSRKRQRHG